MYLDEALRRMLDAAAKCSEVSISSSVELQVLVFKCLEFVEPLPPPGEDRGESVSSLEGRLALMHRLFVGGGSTSISSTLAR